MPASAYYDVYVGDVVTHVDGSYTVSGWDSGEGSESNHFKLNSKSTYSASERAYDLTDFSSEWGEEYSLETEHDVDGEYTTIYSDGVANGTYNSSGSADHSLTMQYKRELDDDGIKFTEQSGVASGGHTLDYDFDETGDYTYGLIEGTAAYSGEEHETSDYHKDYKIKPGTTNTWMVKGTGNTSASGEYHSSYNGSGDYFDVLDDHVLIGTATESGEDHYDYDVSAGFELGPNDQWIRVSGNGSESFSGEHDSDTDAPGATRTTSVPTTST